MENSLHSHYFLLVSEQAMWALCFFLQAMWALCYQRCPDVPLETPVIQHCTKRRRHHRLSVETRSRGLMTNSAVNTEVIPQVEARLREGTKKVAEAHRQEEH